MLSQKESNAPKKCIQAPNMFVKGLTDLQSIASRDARSPEYKLLGNQGSRSRSAGILHDYYQKMSQNEDKDTSKSVYNGFASQVEGIRKAFLMRPGCPQFSSRATSMSQYGTTIASLPKELDSNTETWELSEEMVLEQSDFDTNMNEHPLSSSKSACEFNYLQRKNKFEVLSPKTSCLDIAQPYPRKHLPWYISVIHEKDNMLFMLGKEVQRLSELERQSRKKNEEILMLWKEMEALKKQLQHLLKGRVGEMVMSPGLQEDSGSPCLYEDQLLPPCQEDTSKHHITPEALWERFESLRTHLSFLEEQLPESPTKQKQLSLSVLPEVSREEEEAESPLGWKQDSMVAQKGKDLKGGEEEEDLARAAEGAQGSGKRAADKKGAVQEEMDEEEEGVKEEEEESPVEEERDDEEKDEIQKRIYSLDETFEDELMARLEEYEQVVEEIQCDLEITRNRYSLATGVIMSLQRQVDFQESQLRKVNMENEILQKELRERKNQLQAMSDKFSNLREGKKHEEMMGLIEKDNLLLRQQVMDLERELMNRDQVISEYTAKVHQLQIQLSLEQKHLQQGKQLQEELQNRSELIQQEEQQARVALESAQARLERLRDKIIQTTFNSTGIKSMSTEISDNEVLDVLQRIISERTEYYNQLKQKGVKVPPLSPSDSMFPTSGKSKKGSPK